MKRILPLLAVAAVAVVPSAGHTAVKRVERTVTADYVLACQAGIDGANGGISGCPNELADVAKKGEAYVRFSATDATGQPVGLVSYDPSAYDTTAANHCGGIDKPVKIKAGNEIGIKTIIDPTCGAVPTQGTLTITFSNLP